MQILNVGTDLEGNNTLFDWTQYDSEDPNNSDGPVIEVLEDLDLIKISVQGELLLDMTLFGYGLKSRKLMSIFIYYHYTSGELNTNLSHWEYTNQKTT